jgi:subtilase-type serine protease
MKTEFKAIWAAAITAVILVSTDHAARAQQAPAQGNEYTQSNNLNQINAASAYTQGFTGQGVTIGVIDTGIDLRHPDLSTAGKFVGGIKFTNAFDPNVTDPTAFTAMSAGTNSDSDPGSSHGTFVSSIAAGALNGSGIQGVAYNAGLYVAAINTAPLAGSTDLDTQLSLAVQNLSSNGVKIINFSLGTDNCAEGKGVGDPANAGKAHCNMSDYTATQADAQYGQFKDAAQQAINNGSLLVFATGNEGQTSADVLGGLAKFHSGLQQGVLAVGAVDNQNVITDYSNRCGEAAQWCLVAPGNLRGATVLGAGNVSRQVNGQPGNYYSDAQGTSFATPTVSGVAALVSQAFAWYTPKDLQQTLLTTATDLGAQGVDDVYGWGLVNAGKAVRGYGQFTANTTLDTKGATSTFSNDISGAGGLTKTGTGTLILTGTDSYQGATAVNGGTLQVDGVVQTSAITVNNGGILSGVGKIGDPIINAGGTLSPGNSANPYGTMTIAEPLTFNAGSYFAVNIAPDANSKVALTNNATATINGGTVQASYRAGSYITKQYTLLSGGTVTGTFSNLTNSNIPVGFSTNLSYTPTSVLLNLTAGLATPGLNANQQGVSGALNTFFNNGGALPGDLATIYNLTGTPLAQGLNQLSPQTQVAQQAANYQASQQFTGNLLSCRMPGEGASAIAREGQCVWLKGVQRYLNVASSGTDQGFNDNTSSISAGAQFAIDSNWTGGLGIDYDSTTVTSGNGKSSGGRFNAGAVVKYTAGPAQIAAAVSGGWGNSDTTRAVNVAGLSSVLTGKDKTDVYTALVRASYVFDLDGIYLKPMTEFTLTRVVFGAYNETGGNSALALYGGAQNVFTISPALEMGTNGAADWLFDGAWLRPFARVGASWHSIDHFDRTASFISAPQPFTTTMRFPRMTVDVGAGFDLFTSRGVDLRFEYEGHYAKGYADTRLGLKAKMSF